ncbi:hypothetical protein [Streptomyces sp. NPDC090053]|uniref:hypothetical protein n=1 Tax=Streptomyces sp. NPDC090053 TaxID=3365932 RepID=UPI0037FB1A19
MILLAGSMPWLVSGTVAEVLMLWLYRSGAGLAGSAFGLADFAAEDAGELIENAVGFPASEVAVGVHVNAR